MNLPSLTVILIAIRISFCYVYYPRDYTKDKRDRGGHKQLQWTQEWFNCCAKDNCTSYRGTLNTPQGKGLRACYEWTDEMKQKYPDAGLESNYCRNPGGSKFAPWCFVHQSDPKERNWRYCRVCLKDYQRPCYAAYERPKEDTNDVCSRMDLINICGEYDASSTYDSKHAAANAFKPQTSNAPWANEGGAFPVKVWIKFRSNVHLNRISFTSRHRSKWNTFLEQAPETFNVIASNDGENWSTLLHVESASFTDASQTNTWDVACNENFFKFVGIEVLKAGGGIGGWTAITNITMWGQAHRGGKSLTLDCLKRGEVCSLDTGLENGGCCPVHHTRSKEFQWRGQFYLTDFRNMTCKKNKQDGAMRCETDCIEKGENNPDIQRFPRREYCCWGLDRRYTYQNCL